MKFKIFSILLLFLILVIGSTGFLATAEEGQEEDSSFTDFIQELYYTVLDYELVEEDKEGEWQNEDKSGFKHNQKEFTKLMKCIFIQGEDQSRHYFAKIAKEKLEALEDLKPIPNWEWPEELEEPEKPEGCMDLDEIFEKQKEHGFKTKCDPEESKNPLVGENWHYCRLTEMVLNELWAKEEVDMFTSDQAKSRNTPNFAFNQEARKPLEEAIKPKRLTQSERQKLQKYWTEDVYGNDMFWTRESVMHALEQYRRNFRNYLYQTKLTFDTEWAKGVYCRYEMIRCWSWDAAFGPQEEPQASKENPVVLEKEADRRLGRFYNPTASITQSCQPQEPRKECVVSDFCEE